MVDTGQQFLSWGACPPKAEKQWLIQWLAKERYPYTTVDRVDSGKNYPNVGVVGLLRLDGLFTDASYDSLESAPNIFWGTFLAIVDELYTILSIIVPHPNIFWGMLLTMVEELYTISSIIVPHPNICWGMLTMFEELCTIISIIVLHPNIFWGMSLTMVEELYTVIHMNSTPPIFSEACSSQGRKSSILLAV